MLPMDFVGLELFEKNFPLHYVAKMGNQEELKRYFNEKPEDAQNQIQRVDFNGRTALHYAALTENLTGGEQCVKDILNFFQHMEKSNNVHKKFRKKSLKIRKQQWKSNAGESTKRFINRKDRNGETALSFAAKNENPGIVQILLLQSADVLSTSNSGEQALSLIYNYTPSAVTAILNRSVFFDYENITSIDRIYNLDLTTIVGEEVNQSGYDLTNKNGYMETELLQSVNTDKVLSRKEILKHPLVQVFVNKKSKIFNYIIFFSIIFHLMWLGLYLWLVLDVYYYCCDQYGLQTQNATAVGNNTVYQLSCAHYPDDIGFKREKVDECVDFKNNIKRPLVLYIVSLAITFKEIFQLILMKKLYFRWKNIVLLPFLIILFCTSYPLQDYFNWQYQISAFGVVFSGIIILEVVNKHIYWSIYIKVLIQVLKRFLAIMPLFFFILIVFGISLRMIFPYTNGSLSDFVESIMLVFETIANGKVEWSTGLVYKKAIIDHFYVSGLLLFMAFYVLMTLLLFRILIGFVVADTKKIQEEEEINNISTDLEAAFMYESILFSRPFIFFSSLSCFKFLLSFREKFMLCQLTKGNRNLQIKISEKEIPFNLRKPLRLLASKNISKINIPKPIPLSTDATVNCMDNNTKL